MRGFFYLIFLILLSGFIFADSPIPKSETIVISGVQNDSMSNAQYFDYFNEFVYGSLDTSGSGFAWRKTTVNQDGVFVVTLSHEQNSSFNLLAQNSCNQNLCDSQKMQRYDYCIFNVVPGEYYFEVQGSGQYYLDVDFLPNIIVNSHTANACQSITCSSNSDCDDSDPNTEDVCVNPGTVDSVCLNTEIAIAVSNCTELQNMSNDLLGDYYLLNNVDCSDTVNWNSGEGFEPIGIDSANKFTGTFDGDNYTINNLYINRPTSTYIGLFGYTGTVNFEVQNLGLENVNITGNGFVGGITGRIESGGTIRNSYTTGIISGRSYLGGLVGRMRYDNAGIINSYSNATINNVGGSSFYTGGLVGDAYRDSYIKNSYSTGNVIGGSHTTGGIAGRVYDALLENSYSTGDVSSDGLYEGGLVGDFDNGAIMKNSYAVGTTLNNSSNSGGLVGRLRTIYETEPTTITNSYFTGYDNGYGGTQVTSSTVFYGLSHSVYLGNPNWNFENTWSICSEGIPRLTWENIECAS